MKHRKNKYFLLLATKLMEKMPHASNAMDTCNFYLKRKNAKLVKRSKIITQQPKYIENANIMDLNAVNIEHPLTSRQAENNPRQAEKVSPGSAGRNSISLLHSNCMLLSCHARFSE